ncbi:MAG: type II toxin-antitoxin system PemK/MazF family toxin [Nocardioides sp.]
MVSSSTSAMLRRVGSALARAAVSSATKSRRRSSPTPRHAPGPTTPDRGQEQAYRGDFTGRATISYAPRADGDADPGEVVWAWVPYEEDHTQGKDRPVLVIGLVQGDLLGLMLTSKDHDRSREGSSGNGPHYYDLGSGDWDKQGRPSEVRLDRVLRLAPSAVRREGAALERDRFDQVASAAREVLGW